MSKTCDGCGKAFELDGSSDYDDYIEATIEIAPNVIANVCGSTKYNSDYHKHDTRYPPKISCLRKAFETKNVCPGCGEARQSGDGPFGSVCSNCSGLIDRAKATADDRYLTYSLHTNLISTVWPDSSVDEGNAPRDAAEKLLDTIARIAQAKGPRKGPDELHDGRGIRLPPKRTNTGGGKVSIQLDESQRKAVEALGAAIKAFAMAMYNQGRRAGRDLLGSLASGQVTIDDFETKHQRWVDEEETETETD
jgi:hypothetical protein